MSRAAENLLDVTLFWMKICYRCATENMLNVLLVMYCFDT